MTACHRFVCTTGAPCAPFGRTLSVRTTGTFTRETAPPDQTTSLEEIPCSKLEQQRILLATIGATLYHYTVKRIAEKDWLEYFDSVLYEQQLVDGAVVNTSV